jgi:hypothetical protein
MVVSYVTIASLADRFPASADHANPNRAAAAIAQVVFIYVIQMAYAGALPSGLRSTADRLRDQFIFMVNKSKIV